MCLCTCVCLYQLLPYNLDDTKVENKTHIIYIDRMLAMLNKIWSPGFMINMNTAFFMDSGTEHWRRVQSSVCYRCCHGSQKYKKWWWSPDNVKDGDRSLAVSNGCYGTLVLSEVRLELWLCQKWGWHSEYISVCLWYLTILKIARKGHLAFSKLSIDLWLCQYLP